MSSAQRGNSESERTTPAGVVVVAADRYARNPNPTARADFKAALRECLDTEVNRLANDLAGDVVAERDRYREALVNIRQELAHGLTNNWEYIEQQFARALEQPRAHPTDVEGGERG